MSSSDDEQAPLSLIEVNQGTPVIREKEDVSPPSKTNPWSLFPAAEAAKAKVSVSVLLLLGVAYGAYHLGSQRHADAVAQLRADVAEVKRDVESCSKASQVEQLISNVAREQAAISGRVMQLTGDMQVLLSHQGRRPTKLPPAE